MTETRICVNLLIECRLNCIEIQYIRIKSVKGLINKSTFYIHYSKQYFHAYI